jgi:hypothetical protein
VTAAAAESEEATLPGVVLVSILRFTLDTADQ